MKYIVTENNIKQTLNEINKFCENGFKNTHDWLRFADKKDKTFDELQFEQIYPVYKFDSNSKWELGEYVGKPCIVLNQNVNDNYFPTIEIGMEIIFTDSAIYTIDTEINNWQIKWQCGVGKIYID